MTLEELIYKGTNTSGISNVSTRGQPITSTFCKKDIKGAIKSAISENPSFKQFLEENHAYGRYVKNVTNQILRNGDISGKLIKCVHRIAHSNYIVIKRLLTALLAGVVHQKVAIIGLDYMLILKSK